jgi:hypothetical protein
MAKGTKLTATSEFGTFTRTTHHNYQFVVIAIATEAARLDRIKRSQEYVAYLQNLIDTQTPEVRDGKCYYKTSQYSSIQAEVVIGDAREAVERAKQPREYSAINWCSRRELAEKAAAQLRKPAYQLEDIRIIPVDAPTTPAPVETASCYAPAGSETKTCATCGRLFATRPGQYCSNDCAAHGHGLKSYR